MNNLSHHGSCLCGDVQFDVELDLRKASRCNCTLCTKLGVTGSMVKPAAFALRSPVASLSTFTRTPEVATRYFCARCHVYCYGQGHLAEHEPLARPTRWPARRRTRRAVPPR